MTRNQDASLRSEKPHWNVRFMRRGMEPPYPFGKTVQVVCALTREDAKERVPASPRYPITASRTDEPVGALSFCRCRARAAEVSQNGC